ncbi:MAG: PAS domain-containing protein [Alphaproteobacteria bacterium]|nr:PAS domain-containing protein [Alphaproteobacteria bacterium]
MIDSEDTNFDDDDLESLANEELGSLITELIDVANDAFLVVNSSGVIEFANRGVTSVTGYRRRELIGEHIRTLMPVEFHAMHESHFESFKAKGPTNYNMNRRLTVSLLHKTNRKVDVGISISKKVLKGQSHFGVIITDLSVLNTALVQLAEKEIRLNKSLSELRRAEERFVLAQKLAQIGSWDWDVDSGELFWSKEVFRIFGFEPNSISPTYDRFLECVHPGDRENVVGAVDTALKDPGQRYDIKHRIIRPDGQIRIVREIGKAEFSNQGEPRLMVGSVQDITESEKLQEQMSSALLREVEANKSKSEFLANLSHELRTPLNAVIGYSSLIASLPASAQDKIQEYASDITRAGEHLNQLVSDILEVSTVELGIVNLNETDIDLHSVFKAVHAIINARAIERAMPVSYVIPEDMPMLDGDILRVKQILVNLITNSIKYSEAGSEIVVSAELLNDGCIRLSVRDHGCGMEKHRIEDAIKRFNRLHSALNSEFQGGLGLGLSMVQSYCDLHDARLTIDSEVGIGTTVCIDFPKSRTITQDDMI